MRVGERGENERNRSGEKGNMYGQSPRGQKEGIFAATRIGRIHLVGSPAHTTRLGGIGRPRFQEGALTGHGDGAAARAAGEQRAHHVGAGARHVVQRGAEELPKIQRKLDQAQRTGRGLRVARRALGRSESRRPGRRPTARHQEHGRRSADLEDGGGVTGEGGKGE